MSLIIIEGFPYGYGGGLSVPDASSLYLGRWTEAAVRASSISPRHGTYLGFGTSGTGTFLGKHLGASEEDDYIVVAAAMKLVNSAINTDLMSLHGDSGATTHITLVQNGSTFKAYRGSSSGTLLGTSAASGSITGSLAWCFVELVARLHDSTGLVEVWVDGTNVLNLTGIDTKNGGTASVFDWVRFLKDSSYPQYDDIYVLNGLGSVNNQRIGDCRVECPIANGNGSNSDWVGSDGNSTDNYDLIDDRRTDIDPFGTDYVQAATTGDTDTYNWASVSTLQPEESIRGVQIEAIAVKTDTGSRSLAFVVDTAAGTSVSADQALATTGSNYMAIWDEDPTRSSAWTETNFNAAEFGHRARP